MAKLKPLYDKIVVKRQEEQEQRTASGIIIPDTAKEKPQIGEVVAVGEGKRLNNGEIAPLRVKVGDKVVFNKYACTASSTLAFFSFISASVAAPTLIMATPPESFANLSWSFSLS